MNTQISGNLPKNTIRQIVEKIFTSGAITRADQKSLRQAMFADHQLSSEDADQIKRVFDRLQMGLLKIVD